MFKQLVVLSSLFAGTGLAGIAMYLQANPFALGGGHRVNLDTYLYSAKTDTAPKAEQKAPPALELQAAEPLQAEVFVLPEVVVTQARSERRRALRPAAAFAEPAAQVPAAPAAPSTLEGNPPATQQKELHPCSKFRELGPMHVDDGVPSGIRGVRDLC